MNICLLLALFLVGKIQSGKELQFWAITSAIKMMLPSSHIWGANFKISIIVEYPGYFKLSDTKCSVRNETKKYTTDEIAIDECSKNDRCYGVTSKCTGWGSCFMHCTTQSLEESNGHNFVYKKEGMIQWSAE